MTSKKILVTGGNRGIGFEICRQLAEMGHQVILTARTQDKARQAQEELAQLGFIVQAEVLEVDKPTGFAAFAQKLSDQYQHLDVLINNAGVLLKDKLDFQLVDEATLQQTFQTNLIGPILLSQQLIPLLQKSQAGRIVNVSSFLGALSRMGGNYTAYRVSKAALNAFTLHLSMEYPDLIITSCHPGHVQTDMGGTTAPRTIDKGAETPVWLATASDVLTGKFYFDKEVTDW
ncbi:hypothetical protein BKI52_16905 [marine bacterium AO1-C]|nr:hypothetical protein BKI52_16905 [marine bacterium AO1-C]